MSTAEMMPHWLKTGLLLAILTALLLAAGNFLGGPEGLILAAIFCAAMNFGSYWFSDKIVLSMHRAVSLSREQAPEIYAMTEQMAAQAGIPVPQIYWIASASPNAFATGRSPAHAAIAVTQGLVESLNAEELKGVIAHELSHVIHRDTLTSTMVAVIAGVISFAAMMLRGSLLYGSRRRTRDEGNPILLLLFAVLMPVAAAMVQFAVSRTREYAADDRGAQLAGNPLYLASALLKISSLSRRIPMEANPAAAHLFIVNPLAGVNFSGLFSTHPPIEKRIARLEALARS